MFKLDYFGKKANLVQSPQFYKQMALAGGLDRVFEVAPAFRAENSNSYRHATEFTSFDVEDVEIGELCKNSSLLINIKIKIPPIIDNNVKNPPIGV